LIIYVKAVGDGALIRKLKTLSDNPMYVEVNFLCLFLVHRGKSVQKIKPKLNT